MQLYNYACTFVHNMCVDNDVCKVLTLFFSAGTSQAHNTHYRDLHYVALHMYDCLDLLIHASCVKLLIHNVFNARHSVNNFFQVMFIMFQLSSSFFPLVKPHIPTPVLYL